MGPPARAPGQLSVKETEQSLKSLKHINAKVRLAGLRNLASSSISLQGDEKTVKAVLELINDRDTSVRRAAVKASIRLVYDGDDELVAKLLTLVRDDNPGVRQVALEGLMRHAPRGDDNTINSLIVDLNSHTPVTRFTAMEALGKVAGRGHPRALAAVSARLDRDDPDMRRLGVEAFSEIADLPAAQQQLRSRNTDARLAAVRALVWIALETGEEEAITTLETARADDADGVIRRVAGEAMVVLAEHAGQGLLPPGTTLPPGTPLGLKTTFITAGEDGSFLAEDEDEAVESAAVEA